MASTSGRKQRRLAKRAIAAAAHVLLRAQLAPRRWSFLDDVLAQLADVPKGEFVCIVEAAESVTAQFQLSHVLGALLQELAPTQAAKMAAQICGVRKKEAYELALQMAQQSRSS